MKYCRYRNSCTRSHAPAHARTRAAVAILLRTPTATAVVLLVLAAGGATARPSVITYTDASIHPGSLLPFQMESTIPPTCGYEANSGSRYTGYSIRPG
eukprot:6213159-Pleurochrysis_carterae.AAC.2